jgi:hypothetical protein
MMSSFSSQGELLFRTTEFASSVGNNGERRSVALALAPTFSRTTTQSIERAKKIHQLIVYGILIIDHVIGQIAASIVIG